MVKPVSRTFYKCEACGNEFERKQQAETCERSCLDRRAFEAARDVYKAAQNKFRKICKHKNYEVLWSGPSTDAGLSGCTKYKKHCHDCDHLWSNHHP